MFAVGVASCDTYDRSRVRDAVSCALDPLGGMSAFVKKGERVLVKPNMLYPRAKETGVTTHPEVVRAVVDLAFAEGAAEVVVGDSPGIASTASVAKASGFIEALKGTGAGFVEFDTPTELSGRIFTSLVLDAHMDGSWAVINVAKAKTHVHAGLTLATKNLFGCVPGLRKSQWHLRTGRDAKMFARLVVDIAETANPRLNVVDAVMAMEGNGPGSGDVRPVGRIAASASSFALDEAMARILGFTIDELPITRAARENGQLPGGIDDVELYGNALDPIGGRDFKRAVKRDVGFSVQLPGFIVRLLGRHATPQPRVSAKLCRTCGACAKICPPKAITIKKGEPAQIDRVACISCFCCQEICPYGAIDVKRGMLSKIFSR